MKVKNALSILALVSIMMSFGGKIDPLLGSTAEAQPTSNQTVIDVLNHLGEEHDSFIFIGDVPEIGSFEMTWFEENPTVTKNGSQVLNQWIDYEVDRVTLYGFLPSTEENSAETVRTSFSLSSQGDLVIETSDWEGYGAFTLILSAETGSVLDGVKCVCHGGSGKKVKKRACKTTECADAGVNCNTVQGGPEIYCQNRELPMFVNHAAPLPPPVPLP